VLVFEEDLRYKNPFLMVVAFLVETGHGNWDEEKMKHQHTIASSFFQLSRYQFNEHYLPGR
jgi:hypothetical protein